MFMRLIQARKKDEGFTLIELLVVIIIIGILAAIAIPVFLSQRESAAKASLTSDARNGAVAIETYFTENQSYPANQAAVEALDIALSANNGVENYTTAGSSFTYCVEATGGAADGWSVTYDSAAGGTQAPVDGPCVAP
jgi:type IV pilus assembly protein PilA